MGACGLRGRLLCGPGAGRESAFEINAEGRTERWLLADGQLAQADYELEFQAGDYFRKLGFGVGEHPFFTTIPISLRVHDRTRHHHVVLLLAPWGYSCYRGS
ncbi:hydroxyisourate hydrolase [Castellaniella defragrans]|uniref:hydroxyisourate hydrolase n=1 Tax=Castellaniella defragrans TaxID=75697 RepID=UPI00396AA3A3